MQTNKNPVIVTEKEKSMLNNANELKDVDSKKLGNHLKEQPSFRDSDVINFSVKDNMLWKNWLVYFEGLCTEEGQHLKNLQHTKISKKESTDYTCKQIA